MAAITLQGNPCNTVGELPTIGTEAAGFELVKGDLSAAKLVDYAGKKVILNIFPSIDTSVCATSVRKFNAEAADLDNTVVLCISKDLPFAQGRFCGAEGLENVETLSSFKGDSFGADYGVQIADGPLAGLFARAVVVVDTSGKVAYTELVPEIAQEPDYAAALDAVK